MEALGERRAFGLAPPVTIRLDRTLMAAVKAHAERNSVELDREIDFDVALRDLLAKGLSVGHPAPRHGRLRKRLPRGLPRRAHERLGNHHPRAVVCARALALLPSTKGSLCRPN